MKSELLLRAVPFFVAALVAATLTDAQTSRPTSQPTTQPKGAASAPPRCDRLAEEVLAGVKKVPESVRNLSQDRLARVQTDVDSALLAAKAFITDCPSHPRRDEVLVATGKLLVLNNQRVLSEKIKIFQDTNEKSPTSEWIAQQRVAYFDQVFSCLKEATKITQNDDLRGEIQRLYGKSYYYVGDFAKAAEVYAAAIKQHPLDPAPDETLCALAGSYTKAGTQASGKLQDSSPFFRGALEETTNFLQRYPTSPFLPHILHMRMKSFLGLGQTEAGLEELNRYQELHHKAVAGEPVLIDGKRHVFTPTTRSEFEVYLDQLEFHIGYMHYVNGDALRARHHMQRQVDFLTQKSDSGKPLGPSSRVYLNRTNEVLESLDKLQGKPAPALDLGRNAWVNSQQLDLNKEKGNVVALLFAAYGAERYQTFARALEVYYQQKWSEGFRAGWISFRKGPRDIEEQKQEVQSHRRRLGLNYPAGIDCSEKFATSRAYNASVGGASFIVLDRRGNVAWFKIDPTERDLAVAARVVDRLLGETP